MGKGLIFGHYIVGKTSAVIGTEGYTDDRWQLTINLFSTAQAVQQPGSSEGF